MRLSTIALSFMALGVACISAAPSSESPDSTPVSRDFARKLQVRDPRKHSVEARSKKVYKNGTTMTWYGGHQLDNPACGGKVTKDSMAVAVKEGGVFSCGDELHLHFGGKMVKAWVKDYCGSCSDMHIDATQGLFKKFASLSEGELHGLHIVTM
jgi:hypothetical protein